jgi:hypothetical protein
VETETLKANWSKAKFLTPGVWITANGTLNTCTVSLWRLSVLLKTAPEYDGGNPQQDGHYRLS